MSPGKSYSMAADSAQSALLERIKDNKEDAVCLILQQSWVIQAGSAGIIVSIHRARQLDYVPVTIMVLEEGRTKGYIEQNMYSYVYDDC
ncbi:hypothetical protein Tco_0674331 [Tanacetum coccineum]